MPSTFTRTVGAAADVKELEYIAALMQTCLPETRSNGTVGSLDIQRLLKSRYGLTKLTHEECIQMTRGLGGCLGAVERKPSSSSRLSPVSDSDSIKHDGSRQQRMITSVNKTVGEERLQSQSVPAKDEQQDKQTSEKASAPNKNESASILVQQGLLSSSASQPVPMISSPDALPENQNDEQQDLQPTNDWELPEEYLDIVQLTSLLLIPVFVQEARAGTEPESPETANAPREKPNVPNSTYLKTTSAPSLPENIISRGLAMILKDSLVNLSNQVVDEESSNGLGDTAEPTQRQSQSYPVLTPQLVQAILLDQGEYERAQDAILLDEMVQAATFFRPNMMESGGKEELDFENLSQPLLNETALLNALTRDLLVNEWPKNTENSMTTMFSDVFGNDETAFTIPTSHKNIPESARKYSSRSRNDIFSDDEAHMEIKLLPSHECKNDTDTLPAPLSDLKEKDDTEECKNDNDTSLAPAKNREETFDVEKGSTTCPKDLADRKSKTFNVLTRVDHSNIDFVIDAHSSVVLVIFIWVFYILQSLTYAVLLKSLVQAPCQASNSDSVGVTFGCQLANALWTWYVWAKNVALV